MSVCENLEPKKVFKFFEELTKIPHGSYKEQQISDYLVDFAKKRNLEVIQDDALNVIIRKPGSKGYENKTPVIIQGHMDMVCEKGPNSKHDFEKDPLELKIEGDFLYANDTTLGADDGIAVAYTLAILDSDDISHPPIEAVFTTAEEVGMDGAVALDTSVLKGKILLNIDSEEEGIFLTACAGGINTKVTFEDKLEEAYGKCIKLEVNGLLGGHSGLEIIKQRANANKLIGRLLFALREEVPFNLVSINGGSKHNAIPRQSEVLITLSNAEDIDKVKKIVENMTNDFKSEYRVADKGLNVEVSDCNENINKQFTLDTTSNLIDFLVMSPNGVQNMSEDIKGLVQTSLNVAVIETVNGSISITTSIRSSLKSLKYEIFNILTVMAKRTGASMEKLTEYPEWEYDPSSKVRELCVKVYEEMFNKEPEISAIHAGLECGLFKETMKNTDMISFGPNIFNAHTPTEHLSISSAERMYKFLVELLKEIN
ncbi:aminoacyl-histidine dipeptidase [Clostridium sp. Ade.TY]|uniref:aminoacyl-histidine dipeptidase n=1 Tax=Clostridium sp. Ade.TY TaxID=1391647 RepID=UPI0003FEF6C6|nr:aminoacyl-histidine dipeptidase [Clostridium sp. Ade.TY]